MRNFEEFAIFGRKCCKCLRFRNQGRVQQRELRSLPFTKSAWVFERPLLTSYGNLGLRSCRMKPSNILRWLAKWLKHFYHMTVRPCTRNPKENRSKSCDVSRSGKKLSQPCTHVALLQKLKGNMKIIKNSHFSLNCVFIALTRENKG